jgi:hypothetical protein
MAAGCDDTVSGPSGTSSSTTINTVPLTESFEATLSPGGSSFYSFSVTTAGTAAVTLASVVQSGRAAALSIPLRISLGTPAGEGCTVSDSVQATPALTPQLTAALSVGIHCVLVEDVGQVTGSVIAAVRFSHL